MLADVLALEVVLGHAVHGGGQVGDGGAEAAVAQVEVGLVPCPGEVEVAGLLVRAPRRASGTADDSGVKSPVAASHSHVPSVSTGRIRSTDLVASQWATSLPTHADWADSGEASRTNHSLSSSGCSMADHRCGLVERPVSSRKIRSAPAAVPRLGQPLQPALQCRCQAAVRRMAVGDEAVVGHRSLPGPRGCRRLRT